MATIANAKRKRSGSASASSKRKRVSAVNSAIVVINASFNNTKITITDRKGDVLGWSSSGERGFKGARKCTPFAAQVVAEAAVTAVQPYQIREIEIRVKGPGPGRESAVRAVASAGFKVTEISDVTGIPFNGCRAPNERRT